MREGGLDGLPFQMQAYWSEKTTCNTPVFWGWAIRNQWLRALLSLSLLWGRRERLKQYQSSQESLASSPWSLGAAWIG